MENLIKKLSLMRDVKKRRSYLNIRGFETEELERILEQVHFLAKGKKKFPRADQMRFTREGLAQSSSIHVAQYRTFKMRQKLGTIKKSLDVGSGIGGDTIAMAMRWQVLAIEKDSNLIDILKHNIRVYEVTKNVEIINGDIFKLLNSSEFQKQCAGIDLIFFDPNRRTGGKRTVKVEEYDPPLKFIEKLKKISQNICVKIAPGVDFNHIKYNCDIEVISFKGEVKEVVLWFGKFKEDPEKTSIIATKLPEKISWIKKKIDLNIPLSKPKKYIFEPDPAFIKAHLIDDIAIEFKLNLLNKRIAYLTGNILIETPILKCYKVLAQEPLKKFDFGAINQKLSELGIGKVDFKSRGVSIDLKNLHEKIKGSGKKKGLVIFTKISDRNAAILCEY